MTPRAAAVGVLAAILSLSAPVTVADEVRPKLTRARAELGVADKGCEQALSLVDRAQQANPDDPRTALLRAKCLFNLGRLAEAGAPLGRVVAAEPDNAEAQLMLGIVRYHEENLGAAGAALDRARELGATGADLEFYTALVRMREGNQTAASEAFERARAADPSRVEPLASYFEAMNFAQDGKSDETRTALLRAVEAGPEDPWSTRAQSALDRMDRVRGSQQRRRWLEATVGVEYDDNVVLRGTDVRLPRDLSDEEDVRLVWGVRGGLELLRTPDWSAGVHAGYAGSAHQDLSRFNQHLLSGSVWLDRRIDEDTVARLQYDSGFAWVDTESFLFPQSLSPSIYRSWSSGQQSRLFSRIYWNDYRFPDSRDVPSACGAGGKAPQLCGPAGIDESSERDRTGHGLTFGLEHLVILDQLETDLVGGLYFHRYFARGSEYSYRGHEARLSTRTQLPAAFVLELGASFTYQPYRHASTYPDPSTVVAGTPYSLTNENRRDEIWRLSVALERAITDQISARLRYRYTDERSNVDVFDYDRSVIGFYLTTRWN